MPTRDRAPLSATVIVAVLAVAVRKNLRFPAPMGLGAIVIVRIRTAHL
jgi:hypothetical protein